MDGRAPLLQDLFPLLLLLPPPALLACLLACPAISARHIAGKEKRVTSRYYPLPSWALLNMAHYKPENMTKKTARCERASSSSSPRKVFHHVTTHSALGVKLRRSAPAGSYCVPKVIRDGHCLLSSYRTHSSQHHLELTLSLSPCHTPLEHTDPLC